MQTYHLNTLTCQIEGARYYRVGEVAEMVGRTPLTIQRWEKDGKIPAASRIKSSNWRVYTEEQADEIKEFSKQLDAPNHENDQDY